MEILNAYHNHIVDKPNHKPALYSREYVGDVVRPVGSRTLCAHTACARSVAAQRCIYRLPNGVEHFETRRC
jgi:hypothetical protein